MAEITLAEFNDLGHRLNSLAVDHATCKGATSQRLESINQRQEETKSDVKELFNAVDKVRLSLTSLNGKMVGMGIVLSILIPIATSILTKIIFR
jgi:hypothetical protein